MAEKKGTARVRITSVDGNTEHPFRWEQSVDDVRSFGYDRLVNDKSQTPLSATWMEFGGNRVDGGIALNTLVESSKQHGNEPDLVLNLAWTTQGGDA